MTVPSLDILMMRRPLAVFDVDETLIWEKSMFSFLKYLFIAEMGPEKGSAKYDDVSRTLAEMSKLEPREQVNRAFYRVFDGYEAAKLERLAQDWFHQKPAKDWFIPEVLAMLRIHQRQGHRIVLLSGSAHFILDALAGYLDADDVLAIELEQTSDGRFTGHIEGLQTIGAGKAEALRRFLDGKLEYPASFIFGYGDHESDALFLDRCDTGFVICRHGPEHRPDWAQSFLPIFVHSGDRAKAHQPNESYANA